MEIADVAIGVRWIDIKDVADAVEAHVRRWSGSASHASLDRIRTGLYSRSAGAGQLDEGVFDFLSLFISLRNSGVRFLPVSQQTRQGAGRVVMNG